MEIPPYPPSDDDDIECNRCGELAKECDRLSAERDAALACTVTSPVTGATETLGRLMQERYGREARQWQANHDQRKAERDEARAERDEARERESKCTDTTNAGHFTAESPPAIGQIVYHPDYGSEPFEVVGIRAHGMLVDIESPVRNQTFCAPVKCLGAAMTPNIDEAVSNFIGWGDALVYFDCEHCRGNFGQFPGGFCEECQNSGTWPFDVSVLFANLAIAAGLSACDQLRALRAVAEAAEAWRDHRCIPGDSNCYAGDHDSCGYRKVVAQLEDAIDHHRTRKP